MNICVYGASSGEIDKSYILAGEELGRRMAARGHGLVFGGGARGLMGAVARGMQAGGGEICGVAPSFFHVDGILFPDCSRMIYTETMRERKQIMEDMSDAFIAAPGGIGTFEEFFEILTLKQLGRHGKPVALLNTGGYYDSLAAMLEAAVQGAFMKRECLSLCRFCRTPEEALQYVESDRTGPADVRRMKDV